MALADKFEDQADVATQEATATSANAASQTTQVAQAQPQQLATMPTNTPFEQLRALQGRIDLQSIGAALPWGGCRSGKIMIGDGNAKFGTWIDIQPVSYDFEWHAVADRESKVEEIQRLAKRGGNDATAYDGTSLADHVKYLKEALGHTKACILKKIKIVAILKDAEVYPADFDKETPFMFALSLPLTSANSWTQMETRLQIQAMTGMVKPLTGVRCKVADFKQGTNDYTAVTFQELRD